MPVSRSVSALTVLAAAAVPAVRAGLAIGNPWSVTVAQAGQPLNVSWYDDDQCPQYSFEDVAKFPVNIDLCVKNGYEIISLKNLSTYIDVEQQAYAIGEPIDAAIGPESSQYFIRLLSTGLTDNSTQAPWATYSANFTLQGMTGTFPQGIAAGEVNPGDNHDRVYDHECGCHKHADTGEQDDTPNPPAIPTSEVPQINAVTPTSSAAVAVQSANATDPKIAAVINPTAVNSGSAPSAVPSIVTTTHEGTVYTVTAHCNCEDDLQHTVPVSQPLTTAVYTTDGVATTVTVPCEESQSAVNAVANPSVTAAPVSSGAVPVNAVASSLTTSLSTKEDGSVVTVTVPCESGVNAVQSGYATGSAPAPAMTTSLSTKADGSVATVTVPCESSGAELFPSDTPIGYPSGSGEQETTAYATTNASYTGMVTVTKPCEVCHHHNATGTYGAPGANSTGKGNGTDWKDTVNKLLNSGDSPRMASPESLLIGGLLIVGASMTLFA